MSTETQTFESIQKLRDALPSLPDNAVILDRDGDEVPRRDVHIVFGNYAPYTVRYENTTPAPLDPSKVKAGDWVAVEVSDDDEDIPNVTAAGGVYERFPGNLAVGPFLLARPNVTLTDHQPAPEPEPEWKPGTVWADEDGKRYLAGTLDGKGPHMYADDGYGIEPDEDLRPLAVVDPAEVNVHHLYEVYVTHAGSGPDGLRVVLAELGIEATS